MSDARFQEVIEVIIDSRKAEADAKRFVQNWEKDFREMFKGKEALTAFQDQLQEMGAALDKYLKEEQAKRISAIKESIVAEETAKQQLRDNLKRINDDIAKADSDRIRAEEREMQDSVARQVTLIQKKTQDEERLDEHRASQLLKINTAIAREDQAIRAQEEKANLASVEKQMLAAEKAATAKASMLEKLNLAVAKEAAVIREKEERDNIASIDRQMAEMRKLNAEKLRTKSQSNSRLEANLPSSLSGGSSFAGLGNLSELPNGLGQVAAQAGAGSMAINMLTTSFTPLAIAIGGTVALLAGSAGFDKKLAEMSTLLEDASVKGSKFADSLNHTADAAVQLSVKFNRDLIEVVDGFKEALSSGIDSGELVKFSEAAGTLSAALNISFTQSANILTSFKDSYKLGISDMAGVNDILFNTVNVGKVVVSDLITNFGRLLPVGRAAGVSLQDLAGGVATLTRNGLPASRSITSMVSMIENLVTPSEKARAAFEHLGLEFGQGALANGIPAFIDKLKAATGGNLDILSQLFPERQALRAVTTFTSVTEQLKENTAAINEHGTALIADQRAMDSGVVKFEQLKKAIGGEIAIAGRRLWEQLADIFFGAGPMSDETMKRVQSEISEIATIFQTIGVVVGSVVKIVIDFVAVIWEAVKATTNLVATVWDLLNLDFKGAAHQMGDFAKNAVQGAHYVKDAWNVASTVGNKMDQAYAQGEERLQAIQNGLDGVSGASKAAADNVVNHWARTRNALDETGESLDALEKKMARVEERNLARHSRPKQLEELKELEDAIVEWETKLSLASNAVDAKVGAELDARRDAYHNASGQYMDQKLTDTVGGRLQRKARADDGDYNAAKEKLRDLRYELKMFKEQIGGQLLDVDYDAMLKKAQQATDATISNETKWLDKRREDREKFEKDVLSKAERYYNADAAAYDKAQKKKEVAIDRINKKMNHLLDNQKDKINALMGDKAQAALEGASGDPARQKRIARDQLEASKEAVEKFLGDGGASEKEFERLMDAVKQASDALYKAEQDISGVSRAARTEDDRINSQIGYRQDFSKNVQKTAKSQIDDAGRGLPSAPNYQSAAAKAAKEAGTQTNEKVEVITANIKLEVDGTVSDATVKRIGDYVQKVVEQNRKTKVTRSDYDPESYGDASDSGDE